MTQALEVSVVDTGDVHVVRLSGELVVHAGPLRDKLIEIAGSTVVVDVSRLSFCDAAGISALVGARERIVADGHGFTIRGARQLVRRVFEVSGLADLLRE